MQSKLAALLAGSVLASMMQTAAADYDIGTSACIAYLGGQELGQTFTASGGTGRMASLALIATQAHPSATLRVYAGAGYGGALLHTQTISTVSSPGIFQTFALTAPVLLSAGQTYSWRLNIAAGNIGICGTNTNPYPGGTLIDGTGTPVASQDASFSIHVDTTTGVCGAAAGVLTADPPTTDLCALGPAGAVTGTPASFAWSCAATACSAPRGYTVTTAVSGLGSISPAGPLLAAHGSTPAFTAAAGIGQELTGFSGCGGMRAGDVFTLDPIAADCTLTASFVPTLQPLTIVPSPGGSVVCTPNPVAYDSDATCIATPDAGYVFDGWLTGCAGNDPTCTLANVTAPTTVQAAFELTTVPITVVPSTGGAVVCTPNPVPYASDATCIATPEAGYVFDGWLAGCAGNDPTCTLASVTEPTTVQAAFELTTMPITVVPSTGGAVVCTPNPVAYGSDATCIATPDAGYVFDGWLAGCTGNDPTCTLANVTAPTTVQAAFELTLVQITIMPSAGGNVVCTPSPTPYGSDVTCTATADAGQAFTGWLAGCTGDDPVCTLANVTAAITVQAGFGPVVDGVCGPADDMATQSAPAADLCTIGTASTVATTPEAFAWTCAGTLGGADAACSAPRLYRIDADIIGDGMLDPPGPQLVPFGATPAFVATPAVGRRLAAIAGCDGTRADDTYTVAAVSGDCTVVATFELLQLPVTVVQAPGGDVACEPSEVPYGGSTTCTATPDDGRRFERWIGAACADAVQTCTIDGITAPLQVQAVFVLQGAPIASPAIVPTASWWMLLTLGGALLLIGLHATRR